SRKNVLLGVLDDDKLPVLNPATVRGQVPLLSQVRDQEPVRPGRDHRRDQLVVTEALKVRDYRANLRQCVPLSGSDPPGGARRPRQRDPSRIRPKSQALCGRDSLLRAPDWQTNILYGLPVFFETPLMYFISPCSQNSRRPSGCSWAPCGALPRPPPPLPPLRGAGAEPEPLEMKNWEAFWVSSRTSLRVSRFSSPSSSRASSRLSG